MSFHLKKKEKTQTLALNTNRILKYFELKQKQPAHIPCVRRMSTYVYPSPVYT